MELKTNYSSFGLINLSKNNLRSVVTGESSALVAFQRMADREEGIRTHFVGIMCDEANHKSEIPFFDIFLS